MNGLVVRRNSLAEDFQQWAKKTEAFFAGVIKESEMMLEWAADQTTEITTTAIDLEFLPTDSNEESRSAQPEVHFAADAYDAYGSHESKRTTLLPTRGRTHWRRDDDCMNRYDPTTEEGRGTLLRTIISPERCSLQELQAGIERWEFYVGRYEKLKGKMDDEIKRAGLESLVPEELEKHLIFNSTRLRTFEDARSEIVTYVEEKFVLIIRKLSDAGFS